MIQLMKFTPKENFFCADLASHYLVGLQYTVRPGNETLSKFAQQWLAEGKIEVVTEDPSDQPLAKLGGHGSVS